MINEKLNKDILDLINEKETEINNIKGKVLWTNSSPTSAFANQTITLSSGDYEMYEIIFKPTISGDDNNRLQSSGRIPKGYGTRLFVGYAGAANAGANIYSRIVTITSNTQITFDKAYWGYGNTVRTENNDLLVPIYVVGYKTGLFS